MLWTMGLENLKNVGSKDYIFIRYEDLIKNCHKEMRKVCKFLNINFSNDFCIPTTGRVPATSNSMYKERRVVGRIYKGAKRKWEKELSHLEKKIVISSFYSTAIKFGYWQNEEEIKKYKSNVLAFLINLIFFIYFFLKKNYYLMLIRRRNHGEKD